MMKIDQKRKLENKNERKRKGSEERGRERKMDVDAMEELNRSK